MDDLVSLRQRIESYADYTDDAARRFTDEQVRAYAGEALARLRERIAPAPELGATFDAVLLRCEFADQKVIQALDADDFPQGIYDHIRRFDRTIVELADRADALSVADVPGFLADMDRVLSARAKTIMNGASDSRRALS